MIEIKTFGNMNKLTVIASGSSGNGYLLDCGGEQLIIECGVPFKECAETLNYDISNVKCAILSHWHSDHCKYVKQYTKHGLRVGSPRNLQTDTKYRYGRFVIMPLRVPHGDTLCFAYVVILPDGQKCLFATDLSAFPYNIKCLNHIFLECNYGEAIRTNAILDGADVRSSSNTHMELNKCISVINRLKSPSLQSVVLLHLSDGLSDAEGFKRAIYEQCGIKCGIAEKNAVFYLKKSDF